jgi:hypothetical protein
MDSAKYDALEAEPHVLESKSVTVDSKTSFSKLSGAAWKAVEKSIEGVQKIILSKIVALGHNDAAIADVDYKTCGAFYIELRKKFQKTLGLAPFTFSIPETKEKKKRGKPASKKDSIIRANLQNKVLEEYTLVENFYKTQSTSHLANFDRYKYCEVKIIAIMHIIRHFLTTATDMTREAVEVGYELFMGTKKISENLVFISQYMDCVKQNFDFEYCQVDLNFMLGLLRKKIHFTNEFCVSNFPRLCLSTKYDLMFPTVNIKPYPSQINLINEAKLPNPSLICYPAKIGAGKTSSALGIAKFCQVTYQVMLFACGIESVRETVANLAYNMAIPFGIGTINSEGTVKITNSFRFAGVQPTIVICDLKTCVALLQENPQKYQWVFLDEPTVGADRQGHPVTKTVVEIMKIAPRKLILSSATLPTEAQLAPIISHFKNVHPDARVSTITSTETFIGCSLQCNDLPLIPYANCQSREELANVIDKLKNKQFIDRLLPAPRTFVLYNKMKPYLGDRITNLEAFFDQSVKNMSQTQVQFITIQLLTEMMTLTDEAITEICKADTPSPQPDYTFSNILTTNALTYAGQCLYIHNDPFVLAKALYDEYNVKNIDTTALINAYTGKMDEYLKTIKSINDNPRTVSSRPQTANKTSKAPSINSDTSEIKIQAMIDKIPVPKIMFPSYLRVNTIDHIRKFNPEKVETINSSLLQNTTTLESIPMDIPNIPDWVYFLLFCGIGVYSPGSPFSNPRYEKLILNMLSERKLAFMISDESMSCGADYPFSSVIIDEQFAREHSINTIFQILGRAGRVGTSWIAHGFVGPALYERMMNFIVRDDSEDYVETQNIIDAFQVLFV